LDLGYRIPEPLLLTSYKQALNLTCISELITSIKYRKAYGGQTVICVLLSFAGLPALIMRRKPMSPYEYINRMFEAKAAKTGGTVRRKIANVEKYASFKYLLKEVEARGFHLIEVGDQYVIFCHSGSFKLWL
jgi:hypothetical protein